MERIQCTGCLSNDLVEKDGYLVCQVCHAKYTIPGSLKGAGKVLLQKATPQATAGSKAFTFLWLMIAGPMFLFVPWIISFGFITTFGLVIFGLLRLEWLAGAMPFLGAICWPSILVVAGIIFVRNAMKGSDQVGSGEVEE